MHYPHCKQKQKGWFVPGNCYQFPEAFWVRKELLRTEQRAVSHAASFLSILKNIETSHTGRCSDIKLIPVILVQRWDFQFKMSLPYCFFSGRPLASYLSFFFCFTLFAMFVILSFWLNFQFFSMKAKGGGLLFVPLFSAFSLWSWAAAFASSFYLILASVSALLLYCIIQVLMQQNLFILFWQEFLFDLFSEKMSLNCLQW